MQKNKVILLRGCAGSGKSTLALALELFYKPTSAENIICSADDYEGYYTTGQYVWSPEVCKAAHQYCHEKYISLLKSGTLLIIVDNTNLTEKAMRFYKEEAAKAAYEVQVICIEPQPELLEKYAERNTHGVGLGKIKQMYGTYVQNQREMFRDDKK